MTEARVPTSLVISFGAHAGALALFMTLMHEAPKPVLQTSVNVDVLIQTPAQRAAAPRPARAPKVKLSTMDFLKLALPPAPVHSAAPEQLEIKTPEHASALAAAPKLEERSHLAALPKLQALNLSDRPVDAAKVDIKIAPDRAVSTLAALPRLEDVGRRRIKNLPQALALEDGRREAVAEQGLPDVAIHPASRRQALAAVAALQEAAPPPDRTPGGGLGSLLPSRPLLMDARPQQALSAPKLEKVAVAPKPVHREQIAVAQKKSMQIEGPLAGRKIVVYVAPAFPAWARDQGILEADVAIRFTVDEAGNVTPDMRVESSSSYGRLDKLAMETLQNWRFAPNPGAGVQWGVITFKFVLE